MELYQIRYFLALADQLNFTRAAEVCNVSQPALTRAIQGLEAELGGDLIQREGRKSRLTDLGERMRPLLEQCYESANSAKLMARAVTTSDFAPVSAIRSYTVPIEFLLAPLGALFRTFPNAQLKLGQGDSRDITSALSDGRAEIALAGPLNTTKPRLGHWFLQEEGFQAILPATDPLREQAMVQVEHIQDRPIIMQADCEVRDEARSWLNVRQAGAIIHEAQTYQDVFSLVEAGFGVAIVPESAPAPTRLHCTPIEGFPVRRTVSAYAVLGRRRSPPTDALLTLLQSGAVSV